MVQTSFQAVWIFSLASLGACAAEYLLKSSTRRWTTALLFLSWVALAANLLARWQIGARAPLANQYESMLFLLWAVLGVFFLFYSSKLSFAGLLPALTVFLVVSLATASLLDSSIQPLVPALQSNWLLLHVATVMVGYGALSLAFLAALVYLWRFKKGGAASQTDLLDGLLYRAISLGFWFLTLGILTGAVWANSAWGTYWSWDPKETWSLVTWIFYAIAIHLRRTRGWRESRFAWLAVSGFAFVLFTYFGVNYLLSGLHSYA
ncbi:MAG: c-type cytochrome biogenesis protein CcsB [Elusimicrobia bacterium RIFCSPLOWO2_12_FULL_59_9]|nr:MAG: c-type cytochrome biogenesis protein CcsB [Elusimicrobia bacterium RIFCSPLOWO2_12_FULL_59_9]